ncbi:MAG TPA: type II toxin-antitoxin system VapC family toxin [Terrimicrobiaceae bacterium]|nr:type II toxin-antitoxin system VapC family toxin [Terrimicrobiaceae bacterium]
MLLLDTSFVIEYEAELVADRLGPARGLLRVRFREPVAISIITLGEFAEGFEDMRDVEAFLSHFRVIPLSRFIAYKTAAMQAHLSRRLGENDAWIAATALAYTAELAGRERAFTRVPRLKYIAI